MGPPLYRLATLEDLDQLVTLRILMQKEVHEKAEALMDPTYAEDVKRYFDHALRDGSYVSPVAEADGRLVAATGLVLYRKPPSLSGRSGLSGYVSNVYTLPEWRGRGISTELMRLTVQHARELGADKLHLGATDAGLSVYRRVGFQPPRFPALEMKL